MILVPVCRSIVVVIAQIFIVHIWMLFLKITCHYLNCRYSQVYEVTQVQKLKTGIERIIKHARALFAKPSIFLVINNKEESFWQTINLSSIDSMINLPPSKVSVYQINLIMPPVPFL